jgi:hypothetical protein
MLFIKVRKVASGRSTLAAPGLSVLARDMGRQASRHPGMRHGYWTGELERALIPIRSFMES